MVCVIDRLNGIKTPNTICQIDDESSHSLIRKKNMSEQVLNVLITSVEAEYMLKILTIDWQSSFRVRCRWTCPNLIFDFNMTIGETTHRQSAKYQYIGAFVGNQKVDEVRVVENMENCYIGKLNWILQFSVSLLTTSFGIFEGKIRINSVAYIAKEIAIVPVWLK